MANCIYTIGATTIVLNYDAFRCNPSGGTVAYILTTEVTTLVKSQWFLFLTFPSHSFHHHLKWHHLDVHQQRLCFDAPPSFTVGWPGLTPVALPAPQCFTVASVQWTPVLCSSLTSSNTTCLLPAAQWASVLYTLPRHSSMDSSTFQKPYYMPLVVQRMQQP